MLKPIIKWVGGKRQIMEELIKSFPVDFKNYHEPFIGGGSVFMELWNSGRLENKEIYLSDILEPLMNLYFIVKLHPDDLITELGSELYQNDIISYKNMRQKYNNIKRQTEEIKEKIQENGSDRSLNLNEMISYASLFLYLNKTGFNGIYRENLKGEYNIPFGKQKNPIICNSESIKKLHIFFNQKDIVLKQCDYKRCKDDVVSGDFVYIDPPYYNTFNSYSKTNFGKREQIELMEFVKELTKLGCKVAISNSDDIFIRDLYKEIPGIKFKEISVRRMVNPDIEGRREIKRELLITNYE